MTTCKLGPHGHRASFIGAITGRLHLGNFLLIVALTTATQAFGAFRDAPLPDDLFVMEPGPEVPDAMKPYVGKWSGDAFLASVHLPHIVVIERMHPNLAWAVWSMGLTVYGGGPSAWYRTPMSVEAGRLTAKLPLGEINYRLVSKDELAFEGTRSGYKVNGTLKREPMPTQPYTTVEPRTYWPLGIQNLQPGTSTSPVAAVFPEHLNIEPASPTLPEERAKWLGKWSGWACSERSCDIKLAVLQATTETARVIHLFASKDGKPNGRERDAVFVGDELRIRSDEGYRMTYRMRANGVVEAFYVARSGRMSWGVMTKEP